MSNHLHGTYHKEQYIGLTQERERASKRNGDEGLDGHSGEFLNSSNELF